MSNATQSDAKQHSEPPLPARETLLSRLLSQGLIHSPTTHATLVMADDGRSVSSDNLRWTIKNGALDLYGAYNDQPDKAVVSDAFVRSVCRSLRFPELPFMLEAVATAVGDTALTTSDSEYSAEIADLADRLGIEQAAPVAEAPVGLPDYNRDVRITFERMFLEPALPRGQWIRRSLRIRNDGPTAVSSQTNPPLMIAYHWLDARGETVLWDGHRSPVLRPLLPGDAITVICDIQTPERPGLYRLQFQALIEGERWVTGDLLTLPVVVGDDVPATLNLPHTGRHYEYGEDHAIGVRMIAEHLRAMPLHGTPLILEVGGSIHPQSAAFAPNCDVVSIDISFAMSQLGQLYFDHVEVEKRGHVAFITCDAHDPPFQEATFDGVVLFAALHHFSDPKRLLVNLRRVLKPSGFVAIMCEPFGPDPTAEAYLRDLRKGINEQCWTVVEHGEIFISSGLKLVSGQLDGGSLKVILSA